MAIAGRVAIVPKGDWSADATYKRLDAVTHNNTLYFAKKDVPAGTETSNTEYWSKSVVGGAVTVDDALSSTSANPVQNKVVTSNLTNLKYGEVAGGKNLFKNYDNYGVYEVATETYNGNSVIYSSKDWSGAYQSDLILKKGKTYAISAYVKGSGRYFIYCNQINKDGQSVGIEVEKDLNSEWTKITKVYTPNFDVHRVRLEVRSGSLYISCFQIEEGTQATDYEPYIPSVKMLAEENAQQSTEMMDIKMLGWAVPRECPIQNEVNGNQFVQKVGRVDLGSLNWNLRADGSFENELFTSLPVGATPDESKDYAIYSNLYKSSSWDVVVNSNAQDMVITLYKFYAWPYASIAIRNKKYTDAESFKQAMQGQYLYYELAKPITKTIDGNEIGENKLDKDNVVNNQTTTEKGFALDARQANPNVEGSLGAQIKAVNSSLNSKKIPSFGIENIFTGTPFCVTTNGEVINTTTNWAQDNGGYQVDITYPKGSNVSLTVYLTLPANSIAIINVNTLNHENIKVSGPCIFYNFANEPAEKALSLSFTGRSTEQVNGTIRYMPLVIHLG